MRNDLRFPIKIHIQISWKPAVDKLASQSVCLVYDQRRIRLMR